MSKKELNKMLEMLEMLPEADLEKLELVAKGMQMAQKTQKAENDKQSA